MTAGPMSHGAVRYIARTATAATLFCLAIAAEISAQLSPVRVRLPGYTLSVSLDSAAGPAETVAASPEATRAAAVAALTELKIPVPTNEPAGLVGNGNIQLLRRLGNERLSKYFDCGVGMSGPQADSWRLTAAFVLWIEKSGDTESRVRMALVAGARDNDASARRVTGCGSTGALESKVLERMRNRVAAP